MTDRGFNPTMTKADKDQYFVKRVPGSLNPFVSVIAMYVAVLALGVVLLVLFPAEGGLLHHFRQLSWIQLALAVSVIMIELGFLLMYRYGWNLSTGNLVTGVIINIPDTRCRIQGSKTVILDEFPYPSFRPQNCWQR